jgi:hypothetical protein
MTGPCDPGEELAAASQAAWRRKNQAFAAAGDGAAAADGDGAVLAVASLSADK